MCFRTTHIYIYTRHIVRIGRTGVKKWFPPIDILKGTCVSVPRDMCTWVEERGAPLLIGVLYMYVQQV